MEGGASTSGVSQDDKQFTLEKLYKAIADIEEAEGPMGEIRPSPWVPDDVFSLIEQFHQRAKERANASDGEGAAGAGNRDIHSP